MKIRKIEDINVILILHSEIFGKDFPMQSYEKKKRQNELLIFVYEEEQRLIGYSIIVVQKEINNLYAWYGGVLPKYQGKGLNKQFLEFLIEYARSNCYDSVTLASSNMRPHMLRLAIKLGFDIYDIKKRNFGDGNKIYFRFKILPEHSQKISLKTTKEDATYFAKIERIAVEMIKTNCSKIVIEDINEMGLEYLLKYLNSFSRYPKVIVSLDCEENFIKNINAIYKGEILFIKKTN